MSKMRISRLAERSGVPATTLRFYEGAGLLPADRSPAGYRLYGEEAVDRLAFIGAAKNLGLPLEEIAELVTVWESGACADVKADLRPRVAARIAEAEARAAGLAAFTAELRTVQEHLDALPDRPGRCGPECGLPVPIAPSAADPGDAPPGGPALANAVPDGATPDGATPDGATPDGATPDGATPDGATPDGATPDGATPDGPDLANAAPGDVAPDGAVPDDVGPGDAESAAGRPVACSLDADGVGERIAQWRRMTEGAVRQEIPDGLRLTLPADRAADIAALAAAEQRCCPFFGFRLDFDGPVLHLEVHASGEGAGLLADLRGPA